MRPGRAMGNEEPKKFTWREQWTMIRSFASYYPKHKPLLILDLTVVIIAPIVSSVTPLLVYRALQVYLPERSTKMLIASIAGIFALTLLTIFFEYVKTRWGHILGVRMETDMRRDLFAHLQKLSFSYFDKTKTGHLMSRISNDLSMIAEVAHHGPEDIISTVLMLISGLGIMLWINPTLTLFLLIPVPFMIFWAGVFQPRMHRNFRKVRKEVAEINSQVENSIQGVREVKSYANEPREIEKFRVVNNNFRTARENVFAMLAAFHSGMMFFMRGSTLIFVALGIIMIYWDKADAAQLITFYMYSGQITMPIMRLVGFVEQYQQGLAAFERFHEIIVINPEIEDKPNALTAFPGPVKGEIRIEDVSFRYQTENGPSDDILRDISLTIPGGSTVALVGESGAGKTTLASLIPRFYEVEKGSISLDGIDIRDLSQRFLRSRVGIVQQNPFLFDTTIRENILFGRPDAGEDELIEAAKRANIYDFILSLPEGFDSNCGENGVRLSGGQRQRISIARVFLKNPPVLIFDEATSSLDNESEHLVQEAMDELCSGRTTLIIAHRLSTIRNADFICCMKQGQIVEQGTHEELLARNGYYKDLYTMHSF